MTAPEPSRRRDGSHRLPPRAGLGLKPEHYDAVLETTPALGFWEVHAENYFVDGGPYHAALTAIRAHYPLSLHGVGLSLAGETPPDRVHLDRLKALIARYEPASFSEHLAWTSHAGVHFNDLLPVPYTTATLARIDRHIAQVQEHLGRRILIENPATYLAFEASTIAEAQFLTELVARSGCGLLLDINNVYVSAINHGLSPQALLDALPLEAAGEIHLAGYSEDRDAEGARLLIDSHDAPVDEAVWALYARALERTGPLPTLIERDARVPPLAELLAEAQRAEQCLQHASPAALRRA